MRKGLLEQSSVSTVPRVHAASGLTVTGGASEAPPRGLDRMAGKQSQAESRDSCTSPHCLKVPSEAGFGFCSTHFAKCG